MAVRFEMFKFTLANVQDMSGISKGKKVTQYWNASFQLARNSPTRKNFTITNIGQNMLKEMNFNSFKVH